MPSTVTTPIERAVARGDFETYSSLVPDLEDINGPATAGGGTLLVRACLQTSGQKFTPGHRQIIESLLERGADPHLVDPDGFSPLAAAAWHGDWASIEVLLDAGVDAELWQEVVTLAREEEFLRTLESQPERAWEICHESGWEEQPRWTPLDLISTGRMWRCDLELRKKRGQHKEAVARVAGTTEPDVGLRMSRMAERLLAIEAPVGVDVQASLDFGVGRASNWGSPDVALALLAAGADPVPAFEQAIGNGRVEILDALPSSAYDVNGRDSDHRKSPWIVIAMRSGSTRAVRWLLDHGADPTLADKNGCTALDHAQRRRVPADLLERLT